MGVVFTICHNCFDIQQLSSFLINHFIDVDTGQEQEPVDTNIAFCEKLRQETLVRGVYLTILSLGKNLFWRKR